MHKLPTNCGTPCSSNSGSKGGVKGEFSVYVGNLDPETPLADLEDLLYELFLQAGPLTRVCIPFNKDTGKHKCYGFVEFQHLDSVPYAILLMHGIKLCGKTMNVKRVTSPSSQPSTSFTETTSTPPNPFFAALQAGLPPPPLPLTQATPISLTECTPMSFVSPQPLPPPMLLPPPNLPFPTPPHPPDGILRPLFPFPHPPLPPTPPHCLPPPLLPFPPFTPPDAPPLAPDFPFSQPPHPFPAFMTTNPQSFRADFSHPNSHRDTEPMEQQLNDELPFSQPHLPTSDSTHTYLHEARLQAHDHPRWLKDDVKQLLSLYHLQQLGQTFKKLQEAMADGPPQAVAIESDYR